MSKAMPVAGVELQAQRSPLAQVPQLQVPHVLHSSEIIHGLGTGLPCWLQACTGSTRSSGGGSAMMALHDMDPAVASCLQPADQAAAAPGKLPHPRLTPMQHAGRLSPKGLTAHPAQQPGTTPRHMHSTPPPHPPTSTRAFAQHAWLDALAPGVWPPTGMHTLCSQPPTIRTAARTHLAHDPRQADPPPPRAADCHPSSTCLSALPLTWVVHRSLNPKP